MSSGELRWPVVLFDLDGTVIDSFDGIAESVKAAFELIEEPIPPDERVRSWIGPPLSETFSAELAHRGNETIEEALAEFRRVYLGGAALTATVHEGMDQLIGALREAGAWVALVTLKGRPASIEVSAHLGFGGQLHEVFGPIPGEPVRTKETMIQEALSVAGATDAVMIGDRAEDITAARATGIDSIGVDWGYGDPAELREAGALEVVSTARRLSELTGVAPDIQSGP